MGHRGGKGGAREVPRSVTVSKALSFLLRHGGKKGPGVEMDDGGWANVADVLRYPSLAEKGVTLEELTTLVATNDKQRFALKPNPDYDPFRSPSSLPQRQNATDAHSLNDTYNPDPSAHMIRASQGHSVKNISNDKLLDPFDQSHPKFPPSGYVVHGTYNSAWPKILSSGGLKIMKRRHMHFATDLPPPLPPLDPSRPPRPSGSFSQHDTISTFASDPTRTNSSNPASRSPLTSAPASTDSPVVIPTASASEEVETVLSGMRRDASVLVWVDVPLSAKEGGIEWWCSANGVILTEGINGQLPLEWITWVERRGTGEVLFGTKPTDFDIHSSNKRSADKNGDTRRVDPTVEKTTTTTTTMDKKNAEGQAVPFRKEEGPVKDNWDD